MSTETKSITFGRYMIEGGKAYAIMTSGVVHDDDQIGSRLRPGWQVAHQVEVVGLSIEDLTRGDAIVRCPLPPGSQTYALLQAAWCEHFGVKVGTRVKITGKAMEGDLGWKGLRAPVSEGYGDCGAVTSVFDWYVMVKPDGAFRGWRFPFHVLEVLPEPCHDDEAHESAGALLAAGRLQPPAAIAAQEGGGIEDVSERRRKRLQRMVDDRQSLVEFMDGNCSVESIREGSVERLMAEHVMTIRQMSATQIAQLTAEVKRLREAMSRVRERLSNIQPYTLLIDVLGTIAEANRQLTTALSASREGGV